MSTKKRILFIAQEMSPYLDLTEYAAMVNKMAIKSNEAGLEVRVIMPRFGTINERRHRLHEVVRLSGINIIIDGDDYPLIIKVASLPNARLQVYFMDNEDYFKRKQVFRDEAGTFFDDNADRAVFFCKSALETVKKFGWPPHVIHCHGWMTSLAPLYLKTAYKKEPVFAQSKVIYTLQPEQFQEKLPDNFVQKAMISGDIKEKDMELFREGTATAVTVAGAKWPDIVIEGAPPEELPERVLEEVKPSRTKKVI